MRNLKFALFTEDETTRFNLCVTLREQPGRFRNKGRNIAIYPIGFPGVLFNIIATQGHKRWVLTRGASFGRTVSNVEQSHCKRYFGFVHKCEQLSKCYKKTFEGRDIQQGFVNLSVLCIADRLRSQDLVSFEVS